MDKNGIIPIVKLAVELQNAKENKISYSGMPA